jgi:hypothetical protein
MRKEVDWWTWLAAASSRLIAPSCENIPRSQSPWKRSMILAVSASTGFLSSGKNARNSANGLRTVKLTEKQKQKDTSAKNNQNYVKRK